MSKIIPKTLLVVKNRAMGDSIIGLSTIQYLRRIHPTARIIYAVPGWIKPLYDNVETAADKIISLDLKSLGDFYSLWKTLRKEKIDTVLELFQSGRTAKFFSLWQKFGGPKYVFHNHHRTEGDIYDQGVIKSNTQRDIDGAWTFFDSKNKRPPSFLEYEPQISLDSKRKDKTIILGVVATRQTKMWPLRYYKEFIKLFLEEFIDYQIIIPLGPGDQKIEDQIQEATNDRCKIIKESLAQLPHSLGGSLLYVGNDTGLKHICVSLGIPSYTLFGPEPPTEWHPYNSEQHKYYYRDALECRTRVSHYCGLSECESMICLNEFKASDLIERCRELL